MRSAIFKVGTRNSQLALAQSKLVLEYLKQCSPNANFELVPIVTTGDYRRDNLGLSVEDKKQWVIEIERRLLSQEIDFAIHSAKDVPLNIEVGTMLMPVLERKTAHDVLILKEDKDIAGSEDILALLPKAAKIGTSSKRRRAQVLYSRKDLLVLDLKGNINTRVDKLLNSEIYDAIILAEAGINRLDIKGIKKHVLPYSCMLPSVGQGQLVTQYLEGNVAVQDLLARSSSEESRNCFFAERKIVELLEADCHSALGVYVEYLSYDKVKLTASIYSVDGEQCIYDSIEGNSTDSQSLAVHLAKRLISSGAKALLSS